MKGAILIIGMISVGIQLFGCTNQSTRAQNMTTTTVPSGCTALYDGTWKGVISDSGSLLVTRYDANGEEFTTHNPFIASYDFEMTIKCIGGDKNRWSYDVTHVKASHPLFECTTGCTPVPDIPNKVGSWMELLSNGSGYMQIIFSNGATIETFIDDNAIQVSPNGSTMALYAPRNNDGTFVSSIGWQTTDGSGFPSIETDNCVRLNGEGTCTIEYINKNTMYLNKVE